MMPAATLSSPENTATACGLLPNCDVSLPSDPRSYGDELKPFAGIGRNKFAVTDGGDQLLVFAEELAHDARCAKCGSLLYSVVRDGAYVDVTLGTLTDDAAIRPSEHIFVRSKASWFTIADDLPQYSAHVADRPPVS